MSSAPRQLGCTARHWFAPARQVGLRSPVCVRCGAPNPRPLNEHERAEWEFYLTTIHESRRRRYTEAEAKGER